MPSLKQRFFDVSPKWPRTDFSPLHAAKRIADPRTRLFARVAALGAILLLVVFSVAVARAEGTAGLSKFLSAIGTPALLFLTLMMVVHHVSTVFALVIAPFSANKRDVPPS